MGFVDEIENSDEQLPHISKSRVKTWKTCPRKFWFQYIFGYRTGDTFYTKRGTRLHKTYELFHENAEAAIDAGTFDASYLEQYLPYDEVGLWLDWVDPFVVNFIRFEERRWHEACKHSENPARLWLPQEVEAEGWLDEPPVADSPPWMGYADAVLHAASVPDVDRDEGYVILDYKTGKTPDPKYREEGIFLEGEFYACLFEDELEIAAVAGYYPMNDDFIVAPLDDARREVINAAVEMMIGSRKMADFPIEEQPLCKWKPGKDNECDFYRICSSRWGCRGGPGPTFDDAPDREREEPTTQPGYGDRWLN
ncbi:RecB family exonuclease [Halorubellus litoreus]|uniref:RecB family exonuclease n=1 Tax=Halorubellus litoreus TaxID=755308 RepID=A0ABD5VKJ1_9EURY